MSIDQGVEFPIHCVIKITHPKLHYGKYYQECFGQYLNSLSLIPDNHLQYQTLSPNRYKVICPVKTFQKITTKYASDIMKRIVEIII